MPMQQGSGCGGLVWAQLLQPLSTESACQLLKQTLQKPTARVSTWSSFPSSFLPQLPCAPCLLLFIRNSPVNFTSVE